MSEQLSQKVHVIVVTYNGIEWIDKCLGSLERSVYPVEIIVIDNGSEDGTLEFIEKNYQNIDLIKSNKNLGFGAANNIGIKKALENGSEYIFLLNQDAWIESTTIRILVNIAEKNTKFGIISPMHLDRNGTALDYLFSTYIDSSQCPDMISDIYLRKEKELYSLDMVNAAAWLVSKSVFRDVGYFDDLFFMYGEDDNFADRTIYHGYEIGVTPKTCIYHDREDKMINQKEARLDYSTQLKRMKRIVLNPNITYFGKQYLLFRKSMSDALLNIQTGHLKASLKNLKIFFLGCYYNIRYHNHYK